MFSIQAGKPAKHFDRQVPEVSIHRSHICDHASCSAFAFPGDSNNILGIERHPYRHFFHFIITFRF